MTDISLDLHHQIVEQARETGRQDGLKEAADALPGMVKPLMWKKDSPDYGLGGWRADSPFGQYYAFPGDDDDLWRWGNLQTLHSECIFGCDDDRSEFTTREEAVSDAGRDYLMRVMASLGIEDKDQ